VFIRHIKVKLLRWWA